MKKWNLTKTDRAQFANQLAWMKQKNNCSDLLGALLVGRGYDAEEAALLLSDELLFDDPFEMIDMDKAVNRINEAVDNFEHIVIYGDYDCDGVTASVLLYTFLESLGADVEIRLPNRLTDGYGLHEPAVKKMAEDGTSLIITVDNGISAIEEAKLIAELGMDLVVTDHHLPGDVLPQAIAVVNPHRADCPSRFKDLAGCGVALKLVAAMQDGDYVTALESFAALAAIGTIGDIMPMVDENRSIVRFGMQMMQNEDMPGLSALLDAAGVRKNHITSKDIGFSVVPRINAAGRLGNAMDAVNLLLCEDFSEAISLAGHLSECNAARQKLEQNIGDMIALDFAKDPSKTWQRVIVAVGEDWHPGVIGICAARLQEKYGKPAIVLSIDKETGIAHGSGRSFGSFHMYEALAATKEHLIAFGGHDGAGGLSIRAEEIEAWKQSLFSYCAKEFDTMPVYTLNADLMVTPDMLTADAVSELDRLEPYGTKPTGERNKQPVFLLHKCRLVQISPLSGGKHTKLTVEVGGQTAQILLFGTPTEEFYYPAGSLLDFLVNTSVSEYQGAKQVSLRAVDYRSSLLPQDKFFAAKAYYERLRRKEPIADKRLLLRMGPSREEIGAIYQSLIEREVWMCDAESLYPIVADPTKINYCKFRLAVDILCELSLVRPDNRTGYLYPAKAEHKVNLSQSKLYTYFAKLQQKAGGLQEG